jgi:hypothetical protein
VTKSLLRSLLLCGALFAALPAAAQEGEGCGSFKWELSAEREILSRADLPAVESSRPVMPGAAFALQLRPIDEAALSMPPERAPKQPANRGGYVTFTVDKEQTIQVTLADFAWIDLIKGSTYLSPVSFTGAHGCPGVRKSVRFDVQPGTLTLQVSDVATPTLAILVEAVRPAQ